MKLARKIDKIYWLIFIVCIFIFLFFAIADTNIFKIIFRYLTEPEYKANWGEIRGVGNVSISLTGLIADVFSTYPWHFDDIILVGGNFFQIIIPIIVSFVGIKFYKTLNSNFQLEAYREKKSYKKLIWRKIKKEAFSLSTVMYLAFLFLYIFAFALSKGQILDERYSRAFLGNLSQSSPYLYYLIDGFVRFFFVPSVYTVLACAISLVAKNQKQVLLGINIYYFGLASIAYGLFNIFEMLSHYINPVTIMVIGSIDDINSVLILLITSIPFWLGVGIINWRGKHVEL